MQCPKCGYEPTMSEMQRSPDDCVKCGVNYEGHARHVANVQAQRDSENSANAARAKMAPAVLDAHSKYPGAQPVVVVDIKMSFWSMVVFMVKWAFAAIPAILIIAVIGAVLWGFLIGFLGGIGGRAPAVAPATERPSGSSVVSPERIVTPVETADTFWLISEREVGGIVHMTVRTDFANGRKLYSEFALNCSSARGMIVSAGSSLLTMLPDPAVTGFEVIQPNTPRQAIAARGCRGRPGTHELLR